MRRQAGLRLLVLLPCLLAPSGARAWSDAVHERIAEQSARLMPRSLQGVLASNLPHLLEGARASAVDEANATPEQLEEAVLAQTQRVLDALGRRAPMSMVAYELGVLSRLVALAEDPVVATVDADAHEQEWAPDFARFTESRIPKFRVVFSGYQSAALDRDDVRGFVADIVGRSSARYPVLVQSYVGEKGIARGVTFDERHPVFGVASIAYASSISDTARLWLYAWIRSNGDVTEIPFPQALPQGVPAATAAALPARGRR